MSAAGARPDYVQFIDQTHTVVALVHAGIGVAIVPASTRKLCCQDIVFRELRIDGAYADIDFVWGEDRANPPAENFRHFVLEHFVSFDPSKPPEGSKS